MANTLGYGFYNLKQVLGQRANTVRVEVMNEAIRQTLNEHNRQLQTLFSLFVRQTTEFKRVYRTAQAKKLTPLTAIGRPRPAITAGKYENAWPLQRAGIAWGAEYEARIQMTVQEVNDTLYEMQTADARWLRDHILAALFSKVSWTYTDDDDNVGSLTINGLANGDTVNYQIITGSDAGTTDNHYLAQSSSIDNSHDPFSTIRTKLTEHPDNSGDVVVLFPTNLRDSIMGLSAFYPLDDPNMNQGANVSTLARVPSVPIPGEWVGYHTSKVYLAEWKSLPDNYMIATMTGGERSLAMREHTVDALRGFNMDAELGDHPYWESMYVRRAGFGSWNRVGALVQYIGSGTYAVPSSPIDYTAPIG